jgi:hypothetical protein
MKHSFVFLLGIIIVTCSNQNKLSQQRYHIEDSRGSKILVGQITPDILWKQVPEWKEDYDQFRPDPVTVGKFSNIARPFQIICVLGTWCSDSRVGVPPFLKTLDSANNVNLSITLYAVDRNKQDPYKIAKKYNVDRVPTFIVLSGNTEIGRMVEFPEISFETDFLNILETSGLVED